MVDISTNPSASPHKFTNLFFPQRSKGGQAISHEGGVLYCAGLKIDLEPECSKKCYHVDPHLELNPVVEYPEPMVGRPYLAMTRVGGQPWILGGIDSSQSGN